MPRYFFHVHDGVSLPDLEGIDLPDLAAAKREAVSLAGRLLIENPDQFWDGDDWMVNVRGEGNLILFSLHFMAVIAPAGRGL